MKQLLALFVLNKEMGEAVEHLPIATSVPFEKHLTGTEDTRHAIERHLTMLEDMQVVGPELILDEERHDRSHRTQETAGIADGVDRQIAHDVGSLVVLSHLVARRREECKQNLVLWMVAADAFHERATLLKLTQRGSMHPDILRVVLDLLVKYAPGVMLAFPHRLHLLAEECGNPHADIVEGYKQIVHRLKYLMICNPSISPAQQWLASCA